MFLMTAPPHWPEFWRAWSPHCIPLDFDTIAEYDMLNQVSLAIFSVILKGHLVDLLYSCHTRRTPVLVKR